MVILLTLNGVGRVELRPADPNYQIAHIEAGDILIGKIRILGEIVKCIYINIPQNVVLQESQVLQEVSYNHFI